MDRLKSRRKTPWDGETDLTSTQEFLRQHYETRYLNLFAFVTNPPGDLLEKVELVIKTAFENPKLLRYRDYFPVNKEV